MFYQDVLAFGLHWFLIFIQILVSTDSNLLLCLRKICEFSEVATVVFPQMCQVPSFLNLKSSWPAVWCCAVATAFLF